MVKLTRLNGREFVLNSDLIKFIESTPDTVITLMNRDQVLVKESVADIVRQVIEFRRLVRLWPGSE
ncbi:MAG: flagellar FlbD family protein [Planctomycetes bacterium]|nr:flagellar FlbD family protein [Planctomycetota bacterium]